MSGTKYIDIDHIVDKLKRDRDKLNKQIAMVEGLKIEPVTQDMWSELCLTPIRYDDILLDIAEVTFPYGCDFERYPNEVVFDVNGFEVSVPTSAMVGITIDMGWYTPNKFKEFKRSNKYSDMRRYFELLDRGVYNWYDLAMCRCGNVAYRNNKLKLFIWWFTKAKWIKIDRAIWEDRFLVEDKQNEENYKKYKELKEEFAIKLKEFPKVVDLLKGWSGVKGYVNADGINGMINLEDFLR